MELKWGSIIGMIILVAVFIMGIMAGMPRYSVWQQEMSGKAELAKAEQNRQIKIQESKALAESAKFQAEAEITRAKGVAEANKIISDGLKNNEGYLKYLWITGISEKENVATIYIPVGTNGLPIMKEIQ